MIKGNIKSLLLGIAILSSNLLFAQNRSFSGIYPNLAMYNDEGECGTGAVVPWNEKLYVITYGPHLPIGSSDKLYIIDQSKNQFVFNESVGGTPANRMIHKESNNLFIGPYIIDKNGKINTISPFDMPGRFTGLARHLTDPQKKIYYATMEEGFYEYDIDSKNITELYRDVNLRSESYLKKLPKYQNKKHRFADLFGAHGKGAYSGQGVLVYSNNGESGDQALKQYDIPSGSLSEWDGNNWKLVRRNQFVEVTGPGGIYGNKAKDDPIWATGWDHKSILLGVRDSQKGWHFYRLPKSSRSYDGAHGWNTEWPRIREIGDNNDDFLMTMHGMFWKFPKTFTVSNANGIRPRSSYLKVIGDFAKWNNQLVFGCDDSAQKEFLNKRKIKGNLEGAGQSNSNLWFVEETQLDYMGATTAEGAVWINDSLIDNLISEPFLLAGWEKRNIWLKNHNNKPAKFDVEIDAIGNGKWTPYKSFTVASNNSVNEEIPAELKGEWIRIKVNASGKYSAMFSYRGENRAKKEANLFANLPKIGEDQYLGAYLYALGNNQRKLGVLSGKVQNNAFNTTGYYELNGDMKLERVESSGSIEVIKKDFAIQKDLVTVDESSVLVVDDAGRRWRFPKSNTKFDELTRNGLTRLAREVVTERDLMNLHGTFYELPAENADGFAKVRPIASHDMATHDFASFRGLLVLSGVNSKGQQENIIRSEDGQAAVWVGAIDDLWKLGKPTGKGGPLNNTKVKANEASDPYLFGFYDRRSMELSHNLKEAVDFKIQLDPSGNGEWFDYKIIKVLDKKSERFDFPSHVEARWLRIVVNKSCNASAILTYD